MQVIDKENNTDESNTNAYLKNFNRKEYTMPKLLGLVTFILTSGLMLSAGSVQAERITSILAVNSELENTERNVRDSGGATLTPEDQKETGDDRKITATIRQSIVKDKSLSLDAHNAKIITHNGVVTLRGPVENSAEKIKLQSIAEKQLGVKQVDNQLEPKAP
jgi:osmotically-inducible protein OsmY